MFGFFPPSSRDTFLKSGPARAITSAPVFVPPVNEMSGTFGCDVQARPALSGPCTILTTPGGCPPPGSVRQACWRSAVSSKAWPHNNSRRRWPERSSSRGTAADQGEISPATPRGCRTVVERPVVRENGRPFRRAGSPSQRSESCGWLGETSIRRRSAIGFPLSSRFELRQLVEVLLDESATRIKSRIVPRRRPAPRLERRDGAPRHRRLRRSPRFRR